MRLSISRVLVALALGSVVSAHVIGSEFAERSPATVEERGEAVDNYYAPRDVEAVDTLVEARDEESQLEARKAKKGKGKKGKGKKGKGKKGKGKKGKKGKKL